MDILEDLRENHEYCQKEVILAAADEIDRLRNTLQQVLVDAQSQDVLHEWWTPIEIALTHNV